MSGVANNRTAFVLNAGRFILNNKEAIFSGVGKQIRRLNPLSIKIIHWFGMTEISHFFSVDHSDNNLFVTFL